MFGREKKLRHRSHAKRQEKQRVSCPAGELEARGRRRAPDSFMRIRFGTPKRVGEVQPAIQIGVGRQGVPKTRMRFGEPEIVNLCGEFIPAPDPQLKIYPLRLDPRRQRQREQSVWRMLPPPTLAGNAQSPRRRRSDFLNYQPKLTS